MWQEVNKASQLRKGLTTGACATACAVAAASVCSAGNGVLAFPILLPKGQRVSLEVACGPLQNDRVRCTTVKDAGDDPDVTHGATIGVELAKPTGEFTSMPAKGWAP